MPRPRSIEAIGLISVLRLGLDAMVEAIKDHDTDYVWSYYASIEDVMQETLAALNAYINEDTAARYASS